MTSIRLLLDATCQSGSCRCELDTIVEIESLPTLKMKVPECNQIIVCTSKVEEKAPLLLHTLYFLKSAYSSSKLTLQFSSFSEMFSEMLSKHVDILEYLLTSDSPEAFKDFKRFQTLVTQTEAEEANLYLSNDIQHTVPILPFAWSNITVVSPTFCAVSETNASVFRFRPE